LFDFGCNKAEYIQVLKKKHFLKTFGIDIKRAGADYVDQFFLGQFNDKLQGSIEKSGPYHVATAISAIEHAGCNLHPDEPKIRKYQLGIFEFLIKSSNTFFFSVPFGKRPGWAKDGSRKNLYQLNSHVLDDINKIAKAMDKKYLEEIYKLQNGKWCQSNREASSKCIYRSNKSGASAVALVSIY